MTVKKNSFADLEKIRVAILQDKINAAFMDFENRPTIQGTSIELAKPILETLSGIIKEHELMKLELEHLRAVAENCECEQYY